MWADPDVGTGTFFLYLDGETARETPCEIQLGVVPADGRLEEAFFDAEPADEGEPFQMVCETEFDARGSWQVRFVLEGPRRSGEVSVDVEVTPPGLGRIDLLWFLSPFLALAFLWVKVVLKRREYARSQQAE